MTKKIFKRLSLLLTLLMVVSLLGPLAVVAEDYPDLPLFLVADVERFTIGQDFLVEPTQLFRSQGTTAYDVFADLVGPENIIGTSSSLGGIKGADVGTLDIPTYSVDGLGGPDTQAARVYGNPLEENTLGTGSYSDQGYWLCLVNNKPLEGNWANHLLKQGDVLRFAFTYWGYGADVTGYEQGAAEASLDMGNKDKLLSLMASVNEEINRHLLDNPIINDAYMKAVEVLAGLSNQEEVDQAHANLTKAIDDFAIRAEYMTHIENFGWEKEWNKDPDTMSGTTGQSLRLEGIKIKLQDNPNYDVGVRYKTHIENQGWQEGWTENGDLSGTEGKSRRLEAIKIELTGADAHLFDVHYQVHAQNIGWMMPVKNGDPTGSEGFGYRLEGIWIFVFLKDQDVLEFERPAVETAFMPNNAFTKNKI